ncbi:MAG: radical SAM protein [Burkholderiaceae bacterium]
MIQPGYAQIEVTTICNFDCYYCAGREMAQRHMDMAVFKRILDGFMPFTGMPVSLQGEGEPTLHPEFWDMAQAVRAHGLRTYTITNGTRVDAAQFAQALHSVGVSVDTLDAEEARRIGRYNLPKVLANLQALVQAMGPARVTVHTVSYGQDIEPLRAWVRNLGVQRHIVQPLQVKDDYARRYAPLPADQNQPIRIVPRDARSLAHYRCSFLDTPRMRYFDIDGTEMPCCFIKDTSVYTSIDDLSQTLSRRQIPAACSGCRELR